MFLYLSLSLSTSLYLAAILWSVPRTITSTCFQLLPSAITTQTTHNASSLWRGESMQCDRSHKSTSLLLWLPDTIPPHRFRRLACEQGSIRPPHAALSKPQGEINKRTPTTEVSVLAGSDRSLYSVSPGPTFHACVLVSYHSNTLWYQD